MANSAPYRSTNPAKPARQPPGAMSSGSREDVERTNLGVSKALCHDTLSPGVSSRSASNAASRAWSSAALSESRASASRSAGSFWRASKFGLAPAGAAPGAAAQIDSAHALAAKSKYRLSAPPSSAIGFLFPAKRCISRALPPWSLGQVLHSMDGIATQKNERMELAKQPRFSYVFQIARFRIRGYAAIRRQRHAIPPIGSNGHPCFGAGARMLGFRQRRDLGSAGRPAFHRHRKRGARCGSQFLRHRSGLWRRAIGADIGPGAERAARQGDRGHENQPLPFPSRRRARLRRAQLEAPADGICRFDPIALAKPRCAALGDHRSA
ncbi:MAG: hypothetical protein BWZ10_01239 [candidate division BRC1 bacterium ADurb.BinA364]|nr:MAG: hypothetical protein BWZ10_01239 [candidate division BRC1 bacterium ADurb.BinA364]